MSADLARLAQELSRQPEPPAELPADLARRAQELALRAAAPLRAPIRGGGWRPRGPVEQHDVDGLALFDVVRSPSML